MMNKRTFFVSNVPFINCHPRQTGMVQIFSKNAKASIYLPLFCQKKTIFSALRAVHFDNKNSSKRLDLTNFGPNLMKQMKYA